MRVCPKGMDMCIIMKAIEGFQKVIIVYLSSGLSIKGRFH